MIDEILSLFPAGAHRVVIAVDPDGLLVDEELAAALMGRGITILQESDPAMLRHRLEGLDPPTEGRPLLVATAEEPEKLPYDLWKGAHIVTLSLYRFFPSLSYPVVRSLPPAARRLLWESRAPRGSLGTEGTTDLVLDRVYHAGPELPASPGAMVRWLANHHRRGIPLPPPLEERLLARLSKNSLFAAWPLKELLRSRDGYAAFLERQWGCYLAAASGHPMAETEGGYLLPFGSDSELQDSLPGLVRVGLVEPVAVEQPDLLPGWASPALLLGPEGDARRLVGLLSEMERLAPGSPAEARWPLWQEIARVGSELARCVHGHRGGMAEEERERAGVLKTRLDGLFLEWLRLYYSPLSGQVLPTPHHLYHLPHYLAHQRRQGAVGKLALIILDGMSLAAWRMIRPAWAARHPTWRFQERLLLAELPSITPVSRRALVAGRRPADLSGSLGDNRREAREWAGFWASQELPPEGSGYSPISPRSQEGLTAYPSDGHSLCLVYRGIDELAHGSTQGLAGMFAALEVWLERESHWLEGVIADLLSRGYALYLASDHGQTEGRGMGQPSEGILVETRSKRARLYDSRDRAMAVMATFPDTAMWAGDGLLPNGVSVLMAATGRAFAPFGELVVSHGGASLDEMVVPMVALSEEG